MARGTFTQVAKSIPFKSSELVVSTNVQDAIEESKKETFQFTAIDCGSVPVDENELQVIDALGIDCGVEDLTFDFLNIDCGSY